MAHDERHSPPRDDPSPHHHDDLRSRHDIDDDRHRRDHYDHVDDRRGGPPGPPTSANGNGGGGGGGNGGPPPPDRDHDRDDMDRRYRGEHGGHDDRHHEYPDDNRPPNDHPRDHDSHNHNHNHNHDNPDGGNVSRHSPPQHDHNPQDPGSSAPPPDQHNHDDESPELINLFVRNVAKHVQEHQLIDLFSKYGKVDSAVVVRDPHSRECRGFGFVKMTSDKDAQVAIDNLREYEFEGRHISVERAKRNGPHSRTPGAYMGLDRRIRDRYAGMKRSREYAYAYVGAPYAPPPPAHYPPYRPPRYHDAPRPRHDYRSMHPPPPPPEYQRPPMSHQRYDQRGPSDERDRQRRRYDLDGGPRYSPRGDMSRDQRVDGRDPPVPRESADELN